MRGRYITPSGRPWLTWRPQWSTEPFAPRRHNDAFPLIATPGVPWPQGRPRYALEPSCSGWPQPSRGATRPSEYEVGERGWACVNPSQGSAKRGLKTCQAREGAARMRAHRVAVGSWRGSGFLMSPPLRPPHIGLPCVTLTLLLSPYTTVSSPSRKMQLPIRCTYSRSRTWWIYARIPDLPAYGEGETEDEAIVDLKEALRAYIEAFGIDDALARTHVALTVRPLDWTLQDLIPPRG